jgi:hypothetical protein
MLTIKRVYFSVGRVSKLKHTAHSSRQRTVSHADGVLDRVEHGALLLVVSGDFVGCLLGGGFSLVRLSGAGKAEDNKGQ